MRSRGRQVGKRSKILSLSREKLFQHHFPQARSDQEWQLDCVTAGTNQQTVGEAVKRLPVPLREQYPGIPWKEIAGTRDRLSHRYDDLDYQVLWDAVKTDIPKLLPAIERMLENFPDS